MPAALPDISIRQLEYLLAVAESPTWARAAERVGVSPSALSQGLAELERRVGVELFEPVGRRRVLRASAAVVLEHARQVVALTADLAAWSERRRTGSTGRVRVGMIDVAAVTHFPDQLRRFRESRPDVDLTLAVAPSGALLDQVAAGDLDLAVCVEPPDVPIGVTVEPLLRESLYIFAPPDTSFPADRNRWGPWVLFPVGSHTRLDVERRLREWGVDVEVAAESHQPDVLREMVLLGLGWTVLPSSQSGSREFVDDDRSLTRGERVLDRQLVLARREGAVADPAADDLATLFQPVSP